VLTAGSSAPLFCQDLASRLDGYLRQRSAPPFNGVVLIARGDSVLFERAYGFADADLRVPNNVNTRFGIGSLTKPIMAAAVLRLVELGRLRLGDSICSYVRTCPPRWGPVTLEHLLSHTAGIPDLFNELPAAPVESTRAVIDAALTKHLTDTLLLAPGTRFSYSNFGYFLLGYAMEQVTGTPWASVLQAHVLVPAGMSSTEYDDVWRIMPGRARGYTTSHDTLRHIRYRDHAAYAAGGLLSTARDLLRFDRALSGARIVAESTLRVMETPRLEQYALGWQIITAFGHRVRNHTGGTNGFASHLAHYDDGITIILLSNVETEPAKATACDLAALVYGLRPSPQHQREPCRAQP